MKIRKLGIYLAFATLISLNMAYYSIRLANAQKMYRKLLHHKLSEYLVQQQNLLEKLSQQIVPFILVHDIANIIYSLQLFEDQLFVLAKQGLTVPINIQFVSLNVPQQIISSNGIDGMLAPDEEYYKHAFKASTKLFWSKVYIQIAMPKHNLINLGLGVWDNDKYLGQLDVQLAISTLKEFLVKDASLQSPLFNFNLDKGLDTAVISLRPGVYWYAVLKPVLIIICMLIIVYITGLIIYKVYKYANLLKKNLANTKQQVTELTNTLNIYKEILSMQYKYGCLDINHKEKIAVTQLLADIKAVNADLLLERNCDFHFILAEEITLHASKLRMMQILSGILYEILRQLPNGSKVELEVIIVNNVENANQVVFKFWDNGFYTELIDNGEKNSIADVRVKGWDRIKQLVTIEGAILNYVHAAYDGNTIYFAVPYEVGRNVFNLAFQ